MAARRNKSKKRSAGKAHSQSPPSDFVLYLDENLCNSAAILAALNKVQVSHVRHLDKFARGTPDEKWLPTVGANGWILLTADKRIRYNFVEKKALEKNNVREFVFASGNLSGDDMAAALEIGLKKMRKLFLKLEPPFVAAITRRGEVHLRWPKGRSKDE
jgi:hypothetical protein